MMYGVRMLHGVTVCRVPMQIRGEAEMSLRRIIKLGGPKVSSYKYDFKNYLEFIITDKNVVYRGLSHGITTMMILN